MCKSNKELKRLLKIAVNLIEDSAFKLPIKSKLEPVLIDSHKNFINEVLKWI